MATTQSFNLDLIPGGIPPIVNVSQYDKGQKWQFTIVNANQTYTIPSGSAVTVQETKKDGTGFQNSCTFSGIVVTVTETQQMTMFAGDTPAEIVISKSGELIGTLNFIIRVEPAPLGDDTVVSESDYPLLVAAVEAAAGVEANANKAEAYAVGTIDGTPVPSTDPAYHNNAKYYAENFIGYITDAQWTSIQSIFA